MSPPPSEATLYDVLGVPRSASRADIVRAFRVRAKELHPDTAPRAASGSTAAGFAAAKEAYDVLRHDGSRRAYDRQLLGLAALPRGADPRPAAAVDPAAAARLRSRALRFDQTFRPGSAASWSLPAAGLLHHRVVVLVAASAAAAAASWCLMSWLGQGDRLYTRERARSQGRGGEPPPPQRSAPLPRP